MTTMAKITSRAPPSGRRAAVLVWPKMSTTIPPAPNSAPAVTRRTNFQRPPPSIPMLSIGTRSSFIHTRSASLALRQIKMLSPTARKTGQLMIPMKPIWRAETTIWVTTTTGMTAMTRRMPRRSLTALEKMFVDSPSRGDDEPGQRVDEYGDPAGQSDEDDADPQEGDIDPGGLGQSAADAGQDPSIRRPAHVAQVMA